MWIEYWINSVIYSSQWLLDTTVNKVKYYHQRDAEILSYVHETFSLLIARTSRATPLHSSLYFQKILDHLISFMSGQLVIHSAKFVEGCCTNKYAWTWLAIFEWLRYTRKKRKVGSQGNKRGLRTDIGLYKTLRDWTMVIATGGKMNPRYRLSWVHCTSLGAEHGLWRGIQTTQDDWLGWIHNLLSNSFSWEQKKVNVSS